MDPKVIDRFFQTVAGKFGQPATIILTGAAAGSLLGHVRASHDIDFAVQPAKRDETTWEQLAAAINQAAQQLGIEANYAEDIDRWSSITLLDYRRHTASYRRFGALQVRILDPAYWSIGKLARYLQLDIHDVIDVLRRHPVPLRRALALWGLALRSSPKSAALFEFREHVEHFLRTEGRTVWGRSFDADAAMRAFHRAAGIHLP